MLLQWIENSHYVSLEEIAERFRVTTQTARRDIADLEHQGKVRRLHGGVSQLAPLDPITYRQRRHDRADEKARIAEAVVALIPDNATIFLDTGTTCEAIANALVSRERLHVVTYSLRSAAIISEKTDFTLAVPVALFDLSMAGCFRKIHRNSSDASSSTMQSFRSAALMMMVIFVTTTIRKWPSFQQHCDKRHTNCSQWTAQNLAKERWSGLDRFTTLPPS